MGIQRTRATVRFAHVLGGLLSCLFIGVYVSSLSPRSETSTQHPICSYSQFLLSFEANLSQTDPGDPSGVRSR